MKDIHGIGYCIHVATKGNLISRQNYIKKKKERTSFEEE